MQILRITNKEKEIIKSGNLLLLTDKLKESEEIWFQRLKMDQKDHRHVQGVYAVLSDLIEVLT